MDERVNEEKHMLLNKRTWRQRKLREFSNQKSKLHARQNNKYLLTSLRTFSYVYLSLTFLLRDKYTDDQLQVEKYYIKTNISKLKISGEGVSLIQSFLIELLTLKENYSLNRQEADTEFMFIWYFDYRIKRYQYSANILEVIAIFPK